MGDGQKYASFRHASRLRHRAQNSEISELNAAKNALDILHNSRLKLNSYISVKK
jgi:hypothetical protein